MRSAKRRVSYTRWRACRRRAGRAPKERGELRGVEAVTVFKSINTGHEASFATTYVTTARKAVNRLSFLVMRVAGAAVADGDQVLRSPAHQRYRGDHLDVTERKILGTWFPSLEREAGCGC